jgi:hypothetical protein
MVKKPSEPTSENAEGHRENPPTRLLENTGTQLQKCTNLRYRRVTLFPDLGAAPTHIHPNQSNNKQQAQMPPFKTSSIKERKEVNGVIISHDQTISVVNLVHGHPVIHQTYLQTTG